MDTKMAVKVLDLFCGAGGFSSGFTIDESANLAIDHDSIALESFTANYPMTNTICTDISSLHANQILEILGGKPDIILASPPCEEFSLANPMSDTSALNRIYGEGSARLMLDTIRLIGNLNPSVFIIENVAAVQKSGGKRILKSEFRRVGIDTVYFNMVRCHRHGNPSRRLRVFISNKQLDLPSMLAPSVEDTIGDLPPLDITQILSPQEKVPNHQLVPLSKKKLSRIRRTRWGYGAKRIKVSKNRYLKDWVRLHPKQVSTSIIGKTRYIHPFENRLLTVREHARLMSYPDDYIFKGPIESQYNQVGESVPPIISKQIAQEVMMEIAQ